MLCDRAGIGVGAAHPPRIHDLRHTFAVRTLLGWYRDGVDVASPRCRACRPISATASPAPPTGTCPPRPSCSRYAAGQLEHAQRGQAVMTLIAPTLQSFFTDRLARQRQASPRTIASYRDTLRLLARLRCRQPHRTSRPLARLGRPRRDDDRRLPRAPRDRRGQQREDPQPAPTAIRSLFTYAALRHPEHAAADPAGARDPAETLRKTNVTFLTAEETARADRRARPDALGRPPRPGPAAHRDPDRTARRRAHRARPAATSPSAPARTSAARARAASTAPSRSTAPAQAVLHVWLKERAGRPHDPLFPTRTGDGSAPTPSNAASPTTPPAPRSGARRCTARRLHLHVLRHSCAMTLLQAGVDTTVIALWLGHADIRSTNPYLHADIDDQRARPRPRHPPTSRPAATSPPDRLLAFLEAL